MAFYVDVFILKTKTPRWNMDLKTAIEWRSGLGMSVQIWGIKFIQIQFQMCRAYTIAALLTQRAPF